MRWRMLGLGATLVVVVLVVSRRLDTLLVKSTAHPPQPLVLGVPLSTTPLTVTAPPPPPPSAPRAHARTKQLRVICTVLKDEARFVKEWIEFHHAAGWSKVVMYDDASSDNITQVLGTLPAHYYEHRVVNWTYHKRSRHVQTDLQRQVLSRCFVRCARHCPARRGREAHTRAHRRIKTGRVLAVVGRHHVY